jgi:catechol 2,3-dioxygenase-like lactoylglutathione lyase family enzyme
MLTLSTAQPARNSAPTVKARSLAYLIFERPDLARAERFLTDFGLRAVSRDDTAIYFRGTGSAPFCYVTRAAAKARFVGFGLAVASRGDLQKLAGIPGASRIEPLAAPGGGECVRLIDPSGFEVHAVFGRQSVDVLAHRAAMTFNAPEAPSRINATQRVDVAPPDIVKLGHVVLEVADFQATCSWYTQHFGFIPSDVQVLPDGSPAVTFMRLDLGDEPADHHTLALAQGFAAKFSHAAFEVVDADAVGMGQRVLREKGWTHAWGIGRHILGSQIFDYWQDPHGDKHEHYSDGDRFTADVPTGIHAVSRDAMSQWGQPMPRSFTKPELSLSTFATIVHNLRHSPDLTLRKLRTLARLFA